MRQSVRSITVSPEFWMEKPEMVARLLRDKMLDRPADLWLIAVGPPKSAANIMDSLFMYGPAEPEEIEVPSP